MLPWCATERERSRGQEETCLSRKEDQRKGGCFGCDRVLAEKSSQHRERAMRIDRREKTQCKSGAGINQDHYNRKCGVEISRNDAVPGREHNAMAKCIVGVVASSSRMSSCD